MGEVRYEIHVDNDGDGRPDVTYRFEFQTRLRDTETFLYNTGPDHVAEQPELEQPPVLLGPQGRWTAATDNGTRHEPRLPAVQHRPAVHPGLRQARRGGSHDLGGGVKVFAGQRAEGFYVDLGAIFDLGDLRPFENLHAQYGMHVFTKPAAGVNATNRLNVHSIAIQVPTTDLVRKGAHGESDPRSVIGVWTTASRRAACVTEETRQHRQQRAVASGLPAGQPADQRGDHRAGGQGPLEPPGARRGQAVCPLLRQPGTGRPAACALSRACSPTSPPWSRPASRAPTWRRSCSPVSRAGSSPGSRTTPGPSCPTCCGSTRRYRRRAARTSSGLLGGDLAGFPNGRRVFDDVVTVELRAVAGVTYALVDPSYKPDAAAGEVTDGLTPASVKAPFLTSFPYLGVALQRVLQPVLIASPAETVAGRLARERARPAPSH